MCSSHAIEQVGGVTLELTLIKVRDHTRCSGMRGRDLRMVIWQIPTLKDYTPSTFRLKCRKLLVHKMLKHERSYANKLNWFSSNWAHIPSMFLENI